MKILYFDCETTGINPAINEITQLAMIIEVDGQSVEEVNIRMQPTRWHSIDPAAIKTTGISIEELKTFQTPAEGYAQITSILGKYIPKYTKLPDKFYPAGHNVTFDLQFLDAFLKQHGDESHKQWGALNYQNYRAIDTRTIANFYMVQGVIPKLSDTKLGTLCDYFGIKINAHDAFSDIRATRMLVAKLAEVLHEAK
jgi:DNA polymerase-3 subunit epsilon